MKKLLLFSFTAFAMLSPITVLAQKKGKMQKVAPAEVILKTKADSLSYALGVNLVQNGLTPYLAQMKVLTDTAQVNSDYKSKIANEADAAKKSKLVKELNFKLDSINKANTQNLEQFLAGFKQTMNQKEENSAFNTGVAIGSQLSTMTKNFSKEVLENESEFNTNIFISAFSKSLKNEKALIENSEQLIQSAAQKAQEKQEAKKAEELKAEYKTQIEEGDKFMSENKLKDGVVTLPSGLQYKTITMGTGEKPTDNDRVTVHYKGTLVDGTVFDSSLDRGEPTTFGVTQVIKGWTEALKLMPVGSKWILYIPYDLAYGSRDQGTIKPFSNLIFEVDLIEIAK